MTETERVRRVAMLSVHTSPLDPPGTGDAGGLNVYVVETARRLAARGTEVEIFTRATDGSLPETVRMGSGILVHHVPAGPYEGLAKDDLPGQLCAFTAGVMRTAAGRPEQWYDVVHSHYWLSGQVGWLATDRWNVPLVHTMHTMARVKNAQLAEGDNAEPPGREIGEAQVVEAASVLVANTAEEATQLVDLYDADPRKVRVVPPGVDLDVFRPGDQRAARQAVGLPEDALVMLFVGRIQPLKAPDVTVRAAAELVRRDPALRDRLVVGVLGGPSGSGLAKPEALQELTAQLGLGDIVRFVPPVSRAALADWYRAADLVTVPSYNESFGLVAVESLASGTPVVAAAVGGLPVAVGDGGVLVDGHDPVRWADEIGALLTDRPRRVRLAEAGLAHAATLGWDSTVDRLEDVYRQVRAQHAPQHVNGHGPLLGRQVPSLVLP